MAAVEQGYFTAEGIKLDITYGDPSLMTRALATGSADMAQDGSDFVLYPRGDTNLVAVAAGVAVAPAMLYANKDIKSPADLAGKKVAVPMETDANLTVFKRFLSENGVDAKAVDMQYMAASSQRRDALQNGVVDAAMILPPDDVPLKEAGDHELYFLPDLGSGLPQLTAITVRQDWAQDHASLVEAFIRAYAKGIAWVNDPANKAGAIKLLEDKAKVSEAAANSAYDAYVVRVKAYPEGGCIAQQGLDNLVKIDQENGTLKDMSLTGADFMDTSYCVKN
ncbi:ABC transporter substrate-binding protein [Nocardioides cheoyonin]|uniref:ABC transporter substrate-binding protein n=1 Tax=Nocardioides cheoyonin TaxID=3156615 RepID=UPI0032B447CA